MLLDPTEDPTASNIYPISSQLLIENSVQTENLIKRHINLFQQLGWFKMKNDSSLRYD